MMYQDTVYEEFIPAVYKGEDWRGRKVGTYTVLGRGDDIQYPSQRSPSPRWWLECSCGERVLLNKAHVVRYESKSCPNCRGKVLRGSLHGNWSAKAQHVPGMYYRKVEASAAKRGINFQVTREQLDDLFEEQGYRCVYTGYALHFGRLDENPTASLDRINSDEGYEIGNVQWVHKYVNTMKLTLSHTEFVNLCKLIAGRFDD